MLKEPLKEYLQNSALATLHSITGTKKLLEDFAKAKVSLEEKIEIIKLELKEYDDNDTKKEEIRKAAYYALTKGILNHNLNTKNNYIEFIYDSKHKEKIDSLNEVISFVRKPIIVKKEPPIIEKSPTIISYIKLADDFIRKSVKESDRITNNKINTWRFYWKSDPTERSLKNRGKQFMGFLINTGAFLGKQCVNIIRKPIALTANIIKIGAIAGKIAGKALINSDISLDKQELSAIATEAKNDLKDSIIAGATLFITAASTPFAGSLATAMAGLGAVGAVGAVGVHMIALTNTAPGLIAKAGEAGLEGVYRGLEYQRTAPSRYSEIETKTLKDLHNIVSSNKIDIALRKEALEKIDMLEKHLKKELLKQDNIGRAINSVNSSLHKATQAITGETPHTTPKPKDQITR
jgi:hypothetical protein